ncbi:MAG: D-aminoacyl-tRNA deacylase [Planctomycetota bacterium]|jgi:D-tyrosyl-tRNA(Tyr) deacylase
MRVLLQRVSHASVRVDGRIVGGTHAGLLLLVGIGRGDGEAEVQWMAGKIASLRVFPDAAGRMNLSILEAGGGVLAVSQFTLYGDARKGRRPSFVDAEAPERAEPLFQRFVARLRSEGIARVETGVFGADMQVELENAGPVSIWLETPATGEATGSAPDTAG